MYPVWTLDQSRARVKARKGRAREKGLCGWRHVSTARALVPRRAQPRAAYHRRPAALRKREHFSQMQPCPIETQPSPYSLKVVI